MTDCNRDPLRFSRLGPKAVVADFHGGRLTTDAGALLLREVDRPPRPLRRPRRGHPRPPPARAASSTTRRPCSPSGSSPSPWATRTSTTTRPSAPTPRCNWPPGAIPDPRRPLASPPTLCRLENRVDRAGPGPDRRGPGRAVHRRPRRAARGPDPRLRRHRRPGPRPPGGPLLPRLLRSSLLPAAVRLLRRRAAGGLPAPQQHRRRQARPRRPQAAGRGGSAPPGRR